MKILVVLGMGGHTAQVLHLLQLVGDNYGYEYVAGHDDKTSVSKIKKTGKTYLIRNPRLMKDKSLFRVFFNMFPTTIDAWKIISQSKPEVIIGAGPAICIPLFWIAKLRGVKTIFIESWVRICHKSQTGKLVYPVSDLFFVQWRSMKQKYPKSIFAGRLS